MPDDGLAAYIEKRYTTLAGTAGDSEPGDAGGSLGKYISTTAILSGDLGNLFRAITGDEDAAGITIYRCVGVVNTHPDFGYNGVIVWLENQLEGGGDVSIGLDPVGVVPVDDADPQAAEIADEEELPAGIDFAIPTIEEDGLAAGDVPVGSAFAVWCRLNVPPDAWVRVADGVRIAIRGTFEE